MNYELLNEKWMKQALRLAKKGEGRVSPNPMVGAVLVKKGKIITTGYHKYFGGPHAEVEAIEKAKGKARDATLYVSLEPCNYYGKTPPCTEKIIEVGIRKVVAATLDPTSRTGLKYLAQHGIETDVGLCKEEAERINEAFFKYIREKIPFVTVKAAASLDGKIATSKGESKWITSEEARRFSHRLRDKVDAILVGVNTIIRDDPSLLPSPFKERFIRIVLDSKLRIPSNARVLDSQEKAATLIFATSQASKEKLNKLRKKGIRIVIIDEEKGRLNLEEVLKKLGELEITNLLVEGGGEVIASFFEKKKVDKLFLFLAPRIIGGKRAPGWIGGKGISSLRETPYVKVDSIRKINEDLLLEGHMRKISYANTCLWPKTLVSSVTP